MNNELRFYGCDGTSWNELIVENTASVTNTKVISCFFDHGTSDSAYMGFNYTFTKFSNGMASVALQLYGLYDQAGTTLVWGDGSTGATLGFANLFLGDHVNEVSLSEDHTVIYHKEINPNTGDVKEYSALVSDICTVPVI